jgi:hypothetical protein
MRRDVIKNVKIVEPPLEELTRKYSTFSAVKRTCFGGCGCVIFLFIGLYILLKFILGTGPQTIKTIPENFPENIPIYDKENIESITFISGKYKNRAIEIAAIAPKIILSPLLLALDKNQSSSTTEDYSNSASRTYSVKQLWSIINTPISDQRDIIQIKWQDISAEPNFMISYYQTELKKSNYVINADSKNETIQQFSFSQGDISGSFYTEIYDKNAIKTDKAVLTVNFFSTTTNK